MFCMLLQKRPWVLRAALPPAICPRPKIALNPSYLAPIGMLNLGTSLRLPRFWGRLGAEGIVDRPTSADRAARRAPIDTSQAADHLGQALRRAFPLPESGAFSDLLAALETSSELKG
jgi:hypothetical protein